MTDDLVQKIREQVGAADEAERHIIAAFESAQGRRAAKAAALAEYRCPSGCLLLYVWRSPMGVLFYQPPYKLSAARNDAQSSPSGRAKNTRDGERRWNAQAGILDRLRSWESEVGLSLQCDHVQRHEPVDKLLTVMDAATPGHPTRRTLA